MIVITGGTGLVGGEVPPWLSQSGVLGLVFSHELKQTKGSTYGYVYRSRKSQ